MSPVDALSSVFLRPLGLAALAAALPVLALYLLEPDPERVRFPAVEFLAGDRDERPRRPALTRLRRNAVLLLQLLAVAAIAASLAAPYVSVAERRTVSETVVVVDASASMATAVDGTEPAGGAGGGTAAGDATTRFDRAVAAATDAATGETSVVVAGADAAVAARRVPAAEAESALEGLAVTHAPGDLGSAIARAATVAGDDARIVVASDFAGGDWRTAVASARARGYGVALRQFAGGGDDNAGVVDYSLSDAEATVRVKNFGDAAVSREVSLGDATRSLDLDPGEVAAATLPVPAGGGRLALSPGDSFPVDDRVPVAAPADPTVDVLVVTNDPNRALLTALSVIRGTDVTVKRPPASVSGTYDLVVFSRVEPGRLLDGTRQVARETLASGGGVAVQAQRNLSAVDYGGLLPVAPNGTATDPAVRQPGDHRLTGDVTFPAPERYVRADLRSGEALLRTANGTPLLATDAVAGGRVFYYGYLPNGSSFERNYRYPVFWKRVAYDLAGRRSLAALNRRTGTTLAPGGNATVETPAGVRRTGAVALRRVGVYEAAGRTYAAALASPAESNVTAPTVTGNETGQGGQDAETATVPRPLTHLVAGAAVLLVLLELAFLRYRGDL